jgi:YbbR domain-containing protein
MKIKKLITNNFGLKFTAMCLAFFVWAMIAGKERSYSERVMEVRVEYFNVSKNIDVSNVKPEKVRLTVRGTSRELKKINPEEFKIKIDMKDVNEGARLNYYTEDYLQFPKGIQDMEIHPRMIEITTKEFITKEVDVKVWYKGRLKNGIRLIDRRVVPEKVKIFGYKSQIDTITTIEGVEHVNLSEIEESKTIKIPLKKQEEILRFEGTDTVEVFIEVENTNIKKDKKENAQKKSQ